MKKKFKAWDKRNKKWVKDFVIAYNGIVQISEDIGDDIKTKEALEERDPVGDWSLIDWTNWRGIEDYDVIQWIGQVDKFGNEIYEGDILSIGKDSQKWLVEEIGSLERDGSDYGICMSPKGNGDNYLIDKDFLSKCEVVGNILENSDLLYL
jgi:uncharacterized phage protein (TIGR01671 family)